MTPHRKHHFIRKLLLVMLIAFLFYDSNTRIVTDEFSLNGEHLPDGFGGLKVVQISDLHGATFDEGNAKLLGLVREQAPDIIVITGDVVDAKKHTKEEDAAYIKDTVSALAGISPVYYVTGNHEWGLDWHNEIVPLVEGSGATVLQNEYVVLKSGDGEIVLAGVDDPNGPADMKTPQELVSEIRQHEGDKYILMLSHRNDKLEMWSELGVDAVICGHGHGGLVRLPFTDGLVAPGLKWFPDNTAGIYKKDGTQMLVSRGIGNSGDTLRLFNNPEVAVFELRK